MLMPAVKIQPAAETTCTPGGRTMAAARIQGRRGGTRAPLRLAVDQNVAVAAPTSHRRAL
jgi:hypothetical protein